MNFFQLWERIGQNLFDTELPVTEQELPPQQLDALETIKENEQNDWSL